MKTATAFEERLKTIPILFAQRKHLVLERKYSSVKFFQLHIAESFKVLFSKA
jgi:hypothetical protein